MIEHDKNQNKFFLKTGATESFLKYIETSPGEMDITQTFVPESERGQGIAGKLATAALEFAKREKLKVQASCSYIDDFINRHEEYQSLR